VVELVVSREHVSDGSLRAFRLTDALVCIGMHLARMEMRLAVAHFFRMFPTAKVSEREGMCDEDMAQKIYFLVSPRGHRCLIDSE